MDESVLFHWSYDDRLLLAIEYAQMLRAAGVEIDSRQHVDMLSLAVSYTLDGDECARMALDLREEL